MLYQALFCGILLLQAGAASAQSKDPRIIVESAVKAMGGQERFYAQKSVEYTYIYSDPDGKMDQSTERYVFDGELSWAKYGTRDLMFPDQKGTFVQGYDGQNTWTTIDGKLSTDEGVLRRADFLRKTNYYWFAMMFKLLDPGINYTYEGSKIVDGVSYDLVRMAFEDGVGDASDTYILYVNRRTRLVDRFLFTVMDFGRTDPLLMLVEYEEVNGIKLPAKRKYGPSDWDGAEPEAWTHEIMKNIKLNVPIKRELFRAPGS